jgi:hypothetical protein
VTALDSKKQEEERLAAEQATMPDFAKKRRQENIVKSTSDGRPAPKSNVVVASKIPVAKSRPITKRSPIPLRIRTKPQEIETPRTVRFEEKPLPSLPAELPKPRFLRKTAASKAREETPSGYRSEMIKSSAASIRSVRTTRDAPFSPEGVFSPTGFRRSPSKATLRGQEHDSTPSKSTTIVHGKLQLNRSPSRASMITVRSTSPTKSPTNGAVDKLKPFFKEGSDKKDEPDFKG